MAQKQTKAQRKSEIIGVLRRVILKIDNVSEDITDNKQAYNTLQEESVVLDHAIDLICEF